MTPNVWIERYRRPWETVAADEVVDLFTSDVSYRSSVFREPFLGRDAIGQYGQRGAGAQHEVAAWAADPRPSSR